MPAQTMAALSDHSRTSKVSHFLLVVTFTWLPVAGAVGPKASCSAYSFEAKMQLAQASHQRGTGLLFTVTGVVQS